MAKSLSLVALSLLPLCAIACARKDAATAANTSEYGYPYKHDPQPTAAEITQADLMTRIYVFADDSMMGRQAGREGNTKGTAYIAREVERLGLEAAGENGTYFQDLPYAERRFDASSTLSVDGKPLQWVTDFVATPSPVAPRPIENAQVVYGGVVGDTASYIQPVQAKGKVVVLARPAAGGGGGGGGIAGRFRDAAAIATADLDDLSTDARAFINTPPATLVRDTAPEPAAANLRVTTAAAARLLGADLAGLKPGATGGEVTASLAWKERKVANVARNVVAVVRGSDPGLAGEYVAVSAHNDHLGYTRTPADNDSLRAYNTRVLELQTAGGELHNLTPEERASIHVNVDSLHRVRPARLDSIRNGADDDGSGSMAVLEIAEAVAAMPTKPRRSILFIWHTAEEGGLLGSRYYSDRPTVPRDSIVADINIDMIGRGRATDIPGGGDDYLGVVGSKRLSTELGDLVVSVNAQQPRPFRLDYRFDSTTTWPGYNNIYGRSDHANYARYRIPIAFFFTGLHQDYHQVTDEPWLLDFPHYTAITRYIDQLLVEVANRDKRLVVDAPPG